MLLRILMVAIALGSMMEPACARQNQSSFQSPLSTNDLLGQSAGEQHHSELLHSELFNSESSNFNSPNFNSPNSDQSNSDGPKGMRKPPVGLSAEWITDAEFGLATAKADTTLPLLFLGTPPPPLVKVGFAYTDLYAADGFGLPSDLYEYSIGVSWFRKFNDRWMVRTMLGVGFATDNLNTSSDAWQFRGGIFGIYKRSECWSWTFGAVATGRDDLPVIPAVGAVWMPKPNIRYDLTFPKPRVNFLIADNGSRQQWAYLGAGLNGTTWAYQRADLTNDRLTYKDWRFVLGWESRPASSSRMPFALGKTIQAEIGYVFAREFEFENETRVEPLRDSFMFGVSTKF